VQTLDQGHGRIEQRRIECSTSLTGYGYWPGLEQVFRLERTVTTKKTEQQRAGVVYGVTSLDPKRADASRLLSLVRGYWAIENGSHWVRDLTFDEDRSQMRVGNIPRGMASLRNLAIGLLRHAGERNIAAACRRMAAQPWSAGRGSTPTETKAIFSYLAENPSLMLVRTNRTQSTQNVSLALSRRRARVRVPYALSRIQSTYRPAAGNCFFVGNSG